ncbi:hypothetical protein NL676_003712 [Syzygium grande]|nr:hypothetical protein NL676_003712 [Syzygium grande]
MRAPASQMRQQCRILSINRGENPAPPGRAGTGPDHKKPIEAATTSQFARGARGKHGGPNQRPGTHPKRETNRIEPKRRVRRAPSTNRTRGQAGKASHTRRRRIDWDLLMKTRQAPKISRVLHSARSSPNRNGGPCKRQPQER